MNINRQVGHVPNSGAAEVNGDPAFLGCKEGIGEAGPECKGSDRKKGRFTTLFLSYSPHQEASSCHFNTYGFGYCLERVGLVKRKCGKNLCAQLDRLPAQGHHELKGVGPSVQGIEEGSHNSFGKKRLQEPRFPGVTDTFFDSLRWITQPRASFRIVSSVYSRIIGNFRVLALPLKSFRPMVRL